MLSSQEASLRGRIGAFQLHATHDPRETTRKAREAFLGRFVDQVDPGRVLPEAERVRRAESARRAYFAKLAYLSASARSKRNKRSRASLAETEATEGRHGAVGPSS